MNLMKVFAIWIMIAFYTFYFSKMLLLRKKGVQTDQIGKGKKPGRVLMIERLMKIATHAIVPVEVISIMYGFPLWNNALCWIGLIIALVGVAIFLAAMIAMGISWRAGIPEMDKTELVTDGIYRFSRNPAFLGFDMMYIGLLLAYFNWVHLLFVFFAVSMLHLQILQEEAFLMYTFGNTYLEYQNRTGRYFLI